MTREPLEPRDNGGPENKPGTTARDLPDYIIPSLSEERFSQSISLPPSPLDRVHPLMQLPVASIYKSEELTAFQRELQGDPIFVTFADLSAVNIANSCGLTREVDTLVSKTKELLVEAYKDTTWRADAPGFDEVLIMSRSDEGNELRHYQKFEKLWNKARDELLPADDQRVQVAEYVTFLREEMYRFQQEYEASTQQRNQAYSLNGFVRWVAASLQNPPAPFLSEGCIGLFFDKEGPLTRLRRTGDLALQLAKEENGALLSEDSSAPTIRRVLSLVGGHVKMDVILTPYSARAAADQAETRSSQTKKGVIARDTYGVQEQWDDRRRGKDPQKTASHEEVDKILAAREKYTTDRQRIELGKVPKEKLTEALHKLTVIAHSDRELGEGIIRYENGSELPVQILIGRPLHEKESLSLIEIDLTAGGAFTKAFGFSRFGSLFREITDLIKERTNADLIIRYGGGKLYVLTATPLREIGIQALTSAIDKAGNTARSSDTNRATTAQIDYGIRTALLKELTELLPEHAPPSSPVTDFLSAKVKIHSYQYKQAHTVQDLIESF